MSEHQHHHSKFKASWQSYKPLIIVLGFCLIMSLASNYAYFNFYAIMYAFMAYFFILLALFKFFDLQGFADGFQTYDLIAKKFKVYGYIYPFIELFLGLGYLMQADLWLVNWATLIVMVVSGISIVKSLLSGQKIKCACLGTALNVPLSSISALENFGMGAMAALALITY